MVNKYRRLVEEYGDQSTIHGITYILGTSAPFKCDRLTWIIVVLLSNFLSYSLISLLYNQWMDNPVTITIDTVARPVSQIEFPAITICKSGVSTIDNLINLMTERYNLTTRPSSDDYTIITDSIVGWNNTEVSLMSFLAYMGSSIDKVVDQAILASFFESQAYEIFLDPNQGEALNEKRATIKAKFEKQFSFLLPVLKEPQNIQFIYELLWIASADSCEKFLRKCKYGGTWYDCGTIFELLPTGSGPCCTFNAIPNMFKDSDFAKAIKSTNQDIDRSYQERKAADGKKEGLSVLMDLGTSLMTQFTYRENYNGFGVFAFSRSDFPDQMSKEMVIPTGHESFVSMTPFTISASENLRLLDPARRECYFEDEKELDFYTTYSLANCASECKLKATYEKFGCLPWYLPSIYQSICPPELLAHVEANLNKLKAGKDCPHCLPDCATTMLTSKLSTAKFRRCDDKSITHSIFCTLGSATGLDAEFYADTVIEDYKAYGVNIESGVTIGMSDGGIQNGSASIKSGGGLQPPPGSKKRKRRQASSGTSGGNSGSNGGNSGTSGGNSGASGGSAGTSGGNSDASGGNGGATDGANQGAGGGINKPAADSPDFSVVAGNYYLRHDSVFEEALSAGSENNKRQYFENDVALVHFYYDSPTIVAYKKSESMTLIDFISQMGGILGLCMGFSLISSFEIFYWLVIKGFKLMLWNRNQKQ